MNGNRVRTIWNCETDSWEDKWKHQSAEDFAPDQWYEHAGCATATHKLETWSDPSNVQPSISSCWNKALCTWKIHSCKSGSWGESSSNEVFSNLNSRMISFRRSFCGSKETYTESLNSHGVFSCYIPEPAIMATGQWIHRSCFNLIVETQLCGEIRIRIRDRAWGFVSYSRSLAYQGMSG